MYSKKSFILDDNGVKNTADFKYLGSDWESYIFLHIPTGKKISFRR